MEAAHGAKVLQLDVDNVVHPITVEMLSHAIGQAQQENAELLVVRLNTPGGLMDATMQAVEKILASPVPVATFVSPSGARAASAGFFILLAGDVAAMAPGTRTGAASPVVMGRELDPVMRKKVESDAGAWIRSLAARRGRNAALAEKAVSEAKSFTEEEALKENLIDLIAKDEADLLRQLEGRTITRFDGTKRMLRLKDAVVRAYEPTLREKVLKAISHPNIAFILLVLGLLGLYVEFSSPGLIVPGVAGAIMAVLGLAAMSLLPINWLGAALIVLALVLFVLEAIFASYGILGIGGAVAMVLGAMMLVEGPPELRITLRTALAVAVPFAAIAVFLMTLVVRAHSGKVQTGESGLIGEIGITRTALNPSGKVFVHGEYWDATSPVPLPENARVRVTAVEGLRLRVEPLPES
jgi:membrane-bound serine protease (ClpP class)